MTLARAQFGDLFLIGNREDYRDLARLRERLVATGALIDGHRRPEGLARSESLARDAIGFDPAKEFVDEAFDDPRAAQARTRAKRLTK